MIAAPPRTPEQLRLLECWLPLAQTLSEQAGWGYVPAQLEALVLIAAPALGRSASQAEAHGILWYYHLAQRVRLP